MAALVLWSNDPQIRYYSDGNEWYLTSITNETCPPSAKIQAGTSDPYPGSDLPVTNLLYKTDGGYSLLSNTGEWIQNEDGSWSYVVIGKGEFATVPPETSTPPPETSAPPTETQDPVSDDLTAYPETLQEIILLERQENQYLAESLNMQFWYLVVLSVTALLILLYKIIK
jgi:hypothetical protein